MSGWSKLKDFLNEKRIVSKKELLRVVEGKTLYVIISFYLEILESLGFIEQFIMSGAFNIVNYKVVRKIPEKLTLREAVEMRKRPWLVWFKYHNEKFEK